MSVRFESTALSTPSSVAIAASGVLGVLPLASRILAATGGGYVLAALLSVAVLALPVSLPQAVIGGMLGSFAVDAGAVVWVFAARSATRAWIGLIVAALFLLPFAWSVWTAAAPAASP